MTNELQSEYVTNFLKVLKDDGLKTPLALEAAQYFERREDPDQVISDKDVFLNELFSDDNIGVPFSYFFREAQTKHSLESTKLSLEGTKVSLESTKLSLKDEKKKSDYLNGIYQDSSSRVYELESSLSKSAGLLVASGAQNTQYETQISDLEAKLAKKDDVVAPLPIPIPLGYNMWKSAALGLGAALLIGAGAVAYHFYNHEGPTTCPDVYDTQINWKGTPENDGTVHQLIGEYTGLVKKLEAKVAPVKKRTRKRRTRRTRRRAKAKVKPQEQQPVVNKGIYRLD